MLLLEAKFFSKYLIFFGSFVYLFYKMLLQKKHQRRGVEIKTDDVTASVVVVAEACMQISRLITLIFAIISLTDQDYQHAGGYVSAEYPNKNLAELLLDIHDTASFFGTLCM